MNKLPVGRTIAFAYRFTFTHLGTIIGLVWIPLVLIAVLRFLPYAFGGNPDAAPENLTEEGRRALEAIGSTLLIALLYSMAYVPVIRQALGLREGPAMVHFALGPPEFRLFGAILLFALVLICMAFAMAIAGTLFGGLVNAAAGKPSLIAFVAALSIIIMFCAMLFIALRLGFLLVPVTVAEQQISLGRSWSLTRGNFWRILGVILATTLPILLVDLAIVVAIVGPQQFFAPFPVGDAQTMNAAMSQRLAPLGQHMPLYLGLRLIVEPFMIGLNLGACAAAYRALAPAASPNKAV
ncbi:MAG TPA: hypothetical protein VGM17_03385 [Rhizomicrobium sp.]|jgi:hypothetical protein